jgi:hypothetical protein
MTAQRIQWKRGTAAQWTANNQVLALGEVGYERDTGRVKVGDGVSTWTALAYATFGISGGGGVSGSATVTVTGPAAGSIEWSQTVAATGLVSGSRVFVQLAPPDNAQENDPEMLDIAAMSAACLANDTLTVTMAFATPTRGPIPLLYGVM